MTTAIITVRPGTSVDEAQADMMAAGFRHLLVVDQGQRLVGILSDRDLLRGLSRDRHGKLHVAEIMTRDVVTADPRTPARYAAALLIERKIGALPVLDDDLALVGIVTETDFLRVAVLALGGAPD